MTTRGLTLGKYAPLHKGHQLVIDTALAEMDEVTVLVYDAPEVTDVPLKVRAGWVRRLYPSVRVVEARGGPRRVGDAPDLCRRHERFVIEDLGISGVTHFYSSEFYGAHMSRALGAKDRRVDPGRSAFPVSGAMIRKAPYAFREFLAPLVYRDLVTNIVFLGAPSTGKTTLCQRLSREYHTAWMPEYGREFWEKHQVGRRLSPEQLLQIAQVHIEREEKMLGRADRYLFTDTNAITTYMFARYYHGFALEPLERLARAAARRYDLVFLCGDDMPYDDTWDRSGEVNRREFQSRIRADLRNRQLDFIEVRGALEERVRQVRQVLDGFRKYARDDNLRGGWKRLDGMEAGC